MSNAGKNMEIILFEEYHNCRTVEFDIAINLITQQYDITRPVIIDGLDELAKEGYIEYKHKFRDYCHIVLLSGFFDEFINTQGL